MVNHQSVTQMMKSYITGWEQESDQRATFLSCYLLMTENMLQAVEAGQFHDSRWVDSLLHRFAEYYFDALQAYENDPAQAPRVWVKVHDAAHTPSTQVIQNLLLGVNTHINYDLIFTLVDLLNPEWEHLSLLERDQRHADHNRVNRIIAQTIDTVQDQVIETLVPEMDLVDRFMGPLDEWMISELITHWRDDVWQQAVDLLETDEPGLHQQKIDAIEQRTLDRASTILLEDGRLDIFGFL